MSPIRLLVTISVVIYFVYQVFIIFLLADSGKATNLSIWNTARPAAILICFVLFWREAGKWPFWLAIWSGSGVFRFVLDLPASPLASLEAATELFVAISSVIAWRADPYRSCYSPSLLNRMRGWFLPSPQLIVIPLGSQLDELFQQYKFLSESEEESYLKGCSHYEIVLREQKVIVAVDENEVVGIIYNTEKYRDSEPERVRKLKFFLHAHGQESPLRFIVNNGFGFLYRSRNDEIRAAYSYGADIFSISRFGYEMV